MRVKVGSGQGYMEGWNGIDAGPDAQADMRPDALKVVERFGSGWWA